MDGSVVGIVPSQQEGPESIHQGGPSWSEVWLLFMCLDVLQVHQFPPTIQRYASQVTWTYYMYECICLCCMC